MRRVFKWTQHQLDKLNEVKQILIELDAYLPLTLRQIYYQMVGKGFIENKVSEYGMLSQLIKWGRINGDIGWNDVEDRVRAVHSGQGWLNKEEFIDHETFNFLRGYKRHLVGDQNKFIEVWIEKDALSSIFSKITTSYCISTVVCRGFSSITFLHDFKDRVRRYRDEHYGDRANQYQIENPSDKFLEHYRIEEDMRAVMLYFGDFDPSGVEMLDAMETTLKDEMGVKGVEFKRIALLKEDIFTYELPHNPTALKKSDTRANKHLEKYGELAVELDALPPQILEQKIREAIEGELDMVKFNLQIEKEKEDLGKLDKLKRTIKEQWT